MTGSTEHNHEERTEKRAFVTQLTILSIGVLLTAFAFVQTKNAYIFLMILALVFIVVVHELGHFVVAKLSNMKVTEFFVGFGKRLWSVKVGETEYGIKMLPLGGYVKIIGMNNLEEVDPADEARTYRQQPFLNKFGVAIAGSVMHIVMAFLIYLFILTVTGLPALSTSVGSIAKLQNGPSPAQDAGFQLNDKIMSIDGNPIDDWSQDVPPYIRARAGQPLKFVVERQGQPVELTVTPVDRNANPIEGDVAPEVSGPAIGFVGIGPAQISKKEPFFPALWTSVKQTGVGAVETVKGLGKIFSPSGIKSYSEQVAGTSTATPIEQATNRPVSVVGIVDLGSRAADDGLRDVLMLLFAVNLAFGIFNMLPTYPFDGGHALVAVIEKIRSRPGKPYVMDQTKLLPLTYAVVLIAGLMFVTSVYLDITSPLSNLLDQ